MTAMSKATAILDGAALQCVRENLYRPSGTPSASAFTQDLRPGLTSFAPLGLVSCRFCSTGCMRRVVLTHMLQRCGNRRGFTVGFSRCAPAAPHKTFSPLAKIRGLLAAACLVLAALSAYAQAAPSSVTGVVEDPSGAVIAGARVEFTSGNYHTATQTNSAGQFQLEIAGMSGTISARANGFVPLQRPWNREPQLRLILHPQFESGYISQHVLVTASRINIALEDSPADSVTISRNDLASTPSLALDDVLRAVPGFTLFRRSSSRTANPGTQGVSMRGVGASGASRALVLVDDIPLNDPFGGWVYWDRVVRESISDVEVVRGGADASLYGSTAMGGVIQFRTRQPEQAAISAESSWGSENTPELSLWAGTRLGPWYGSASTDLFRTNGYIPVPESLRGTVDSPANSGHELTTVELGRRFGDFNRAFARGSYFDEDRHNGTVIQLNSTQLGDFATGWNYETKNVGAISARLFGLFESYRQTFSAVASDRNSETLTDDQRVPSQALGGSAQWSRPIGRVHTLVAGFEMRAVDGSSNEDLFKLGVPNGSSLSGGQERTARVFGEDILQLGSHLIANLSLGYDHWSDLNARLVRINSGVATLTPYPDRTSDALNPRASLLYHLGHGTSLTASGYRAFRAPTLNELYRNFRQGNAVTNGNSALHAERLTGVEAGVRQSLLSERLNLRTTFFWNDITNAIVNVTLSQAPTLITREKQNVARTLSTGLNLDGEFRVSNTLQIAGGYQYAHAVVSSYSPNPSVSVLNPSLVGNWIPEVPHQQFTLQARYVDPKITATVQGTFVGQQFDNDLNSLLLKRFFTVDLYLGRSLGHGVEVFGAAENTFNQRYYTALTPAPSLGPPILARIGVRYQFPKQ
jgi:outer membrane receptor protein involved in Fe transport